MWRLVALLVTVLAAHPLGLHPTKPIAIVAAVAVLLCAAGVAARLAPLFTVGVGVALGEYVLALVLSGSPPRLVGAVVTGVAAALAVELADFDRRFRGVTWAPGVVARQLAHWTAAAALAVVLTSALVAGAGLLGGRLWLPWAPVVAGAGAVVALSAVALGLWRAERATGDGRPGRGSAS